MALCFSFAYLKYLAGDYLCVAKYPESHSTLLTDLYIGARLPSVLDAFQLKFCEQKNELFIGKLI